MPISINKINPQKPAAVFILSNWWTQVTEPRIHASDRQFFIEQLTLLLETGVNLREALTILLSQTVHPAFSKLLSTVIQHISEGRSFSQALAQHPKVFDRSFICLIHASENGGFMHKVLQELLIMDKKREQLSSTLFTALSYPVFLLFFSLSVVIFILVVVFPKFSDMFISIHNQLPATTKALMWLSNVFIQHWAVLTAVIVSLIILGYKSLRSSHGRLLLDKAKLKLPFIRSVFIELYLIRSLRLMSQSLANGVPILDTLSACREVIHNQLYQSFIDNIEYKVREGAGLASTFQKQDFIPSMVYQMIATGEETGNLSLVMEKVANYYERRLEQRLQTLSKVAEPLMLVVMGAVVGLLVSSLILPIFSLSKAVG